jgi:hypothetical protein
MFWSLLTGMWVEMLVRGAPSILDGATEATKGLVSICHGLETSGATVLLFGVLGIVLVVVSKVLRSLYGVSMVGVQTIRQDLVSFWRVAKTHGGLKRSLTSPDALHCGTGEIVRASGLGGPAPEPPLACVRFEQQKRFAWEHRTY